MEDLGGLVADWPVDRLAAGVTTPEETIALTGDPTWRTRIASVSKLMVGVVALVALEEETTTLQEQAGPEGATVEHLLAHASGMAFDSDALLAEPGRRRIYSNTGIEAFTRHLEERSGMGFDQYLQMGLLDPLGLDATSLRGSPAHGIWSDLEDLLRFAREVMSPSLVSRATMEDATRAHFPELVGVLPGVGSFAPNPWGLAFEIRGEKEPHWTGHANSPRTGGHFGGAGTFLWIDPEAQLAAAVLTDRAFGEWALEVWPVFSDTVLDRYA